MRCTPGFAVSFGWSWAAEAATGSVSSRGRAKRRELMVSFLLGLLGGRMEHPDDPGAARRGKLDLRRRGLRLGKNDRLGLLMNHPLLFLLLRGGRGLPLLRSRGGLGR